jgi:hypothetical protein
LTLWILLDNTDWKKVWNYEAVLTEVWRYSRSIKAQNFKTLTDKVMKMSESQEGEEEKSRRNGRRSMENNVPQRHSATALE